MRDAVGRRVEQLGDVLELIRLRARRLVDELQTLLELERGDRGELLARADREDPLREVGEAVAHRLDLLDRRGRDHVRDLADRGFDGRADLELHRVGGLAGRGDGSRGRRLAPGRRRGWGRERIGRRRRREGRRGGGRGVWRLSGLGRAQQPHELPAGAERLAPRETQREIGPRRDEAVQERPGEHGLHHGAAPVVRLGRPGRLIGVEQQAHRLHAVSQRAQMLERGWRLGAHLDGDRAQLGGDLRVRERTDLRRDGRGRAVGQRIARHRRRRPRPARNRGARQRAVSERVGQATEARRGGRDGRLETGGLASFGDRLEFMAAHRPIFAEMASADGLGEGSLEQRARRPAHHLRGLRPCQAGDVGEPDEGIDAHRGRDGQGQAVEIGLRESAAEGAERIGDPDDAAADPEWEVGLRCAGLERHPQHRAQLGLVLDRRAGEGRGDDVEPRSRLGRRILAQEGRLGDLRIRGHEQRRLVREVAIGSRPRDRGCSSDLLDRRRPAFAEELLGRLDERIARACLLLDTTLLAHEIDMLIMRQ